MKLDIIKLTENLKSMAGTALKAELDLRPYYEHIPFIAKLQMEYGAVGMSVENIEDIKELMQYGIFDFLVVKEIENIEEAIQLSLMARIILTIDENTDIESLVNACKKYNQCIEVIVNYTFDQNYQKMVDFILDIQKYDELDFAGIQAFSTKIANTKDYYARYDACYDQEEDLGKLLDLCTQNNIQVDIVTGLSTATTHFRAEKYFDTHFTETQAGNFAIGTKYQEYNDVEYEVALTNLDESKVYLVEENQIIDEL